MEDILAIVLIFGGGACVLISYSPIGRALADRLRGRMPGPVFDDTAILTELDTLRSEVAELHERVDFSERLLTRAKEDGASG